MKKGILLILAIMSLASVSAKNINTSTNKVEAVNRYNDAVTFIERDIQFHVFLNGDFDFDTHYNNTRYNGVRIERDRSGKVRRVGNAFINYDSRGNVKRIGSIYIDYRYGKLSKVGNLNIKYDRWNNPRFYGNVRYNNHYNDDVYYNNGGIDIDINIGSIFNYNDAYFYKRDFRKNYRKYREDKKFFYYRAVPNAKTGKRGKLIKRRKNKNYSKKYHKKRTTPEQKGRSKRNR